MDNATEESIMDIIGKLKNIDYINPEDIPNIDLYMDQVPCIILSSHRGRKKALPEGSSRDFPPHCPLRPIVVCQIKMCDPVVKCRKAHLSHIFIAIMLKLKFSKY